MSIALLATLRVIASYAFISTAPVALASSAIEISYEQGSQQEFSGIDGLNLEQSRTVLAFPFADIQSRPGRLYAGLRLEQNQFELSGTADGVRRFYFASLPIRYNPRQRGKVSYQWHLEPTYYSDESLTDQSRYEIQFHWQMRYHVTSRASWVLGAARDSGFGVRTWYPRIGLISEPKKGIKHHWVFPNFYSRIALNRNHAIRFHITREGGQWVYLSEEETEQVFSYQQWDIGIRLLRRSPLAFDWMMGAGVKQAGQASVAGNDGDLSGSQYFILGITAPL
ncbi:hypothetical protein HF888_05640 [Bermanella marisrubri]|uniref:Uncharacterized protein n=1 Tax=Bermanella marisrubri TaxID=207949 RepID=Q1MY89_9GAMM|nr:hypothetical protein [Bermanella marisrubri]EAT10921.1 hypothetical protein RED65_02338 [Oceanobacter sp. RED65] [Bermanella marisrubri]QIZ83735.1 hypothetical protein HF888_05640 [Bermanella marisrubri]